MAAPAIVMVDYRLLHTFAAKKIREFGIQEVIIIDDALCNDPILCQIYEMSKPVGVRLRFLTIIQAAKEYSGGFDAKTPCMLILRNIGNVKELYDLGAGFSEIVIANSEMAPGKKCIMDIFFFSENEVSQLDSLADNGVTVLLHSPAAVEPEPWNEIKKFQ